MESLVLGKAAAVSILTSAKDSTAMRLIWISLFFAMVVLAGCTEERPAEPAPAQPAAEPAAEPTPEPTPEPAPSVECTDSDGDDKFTQGKVTVGSDEYVDYCVSPSELKEYVCDAELGKAEKSYACTCAEGACQPEITHVECVDTDGGQDRYNYGEVYLLTYYSDGSTEKGEVFVDACIPGTNNMKEYYCQSGEVRKLDVGCEGCEGGACPER